MFHFSNMGIGMMKQKKRILIYYSNVWIVSNTRPNLILVVPQIYLSLRTNQNLISMFIFTEHAVFMFGSSNPTLFS